MAFAGPFALARRRPALALLFCLGSFLSPFSARHCFARFCAFVVGWAFWRLQRESALFRGNQDFALTENPVFTCGKLLLFSLCCAPLGVSRMEKFVGIFALVAKTPVVKFFNFPVPKILLAFGPWRAFALLDTSLPIGLHMRAAHTWHALT